jgi:hypothetical protein
MIRICPDESSLPTIKTWTRLGQRLGARLERMICIETFFLIDTIRNPLIDTTFASLIDFPSITLPRKVESERDSEKPKE